MQAPFNIYELNEERNKRAVSSFFPEEMRLEIEDRNKVKGRKIGRK